MFFCKSYRHFVIPTLRIKNLIERCVENEEAKRIIEKLNNEIPIASNYSFCDYYYYETTHWYMFSTPHTYSLTYPLLVSKENGFSSSVAKIATHIRVQGLTQECRLYLTKEQYVMVQKLQTFINNMEDQKKTNLNGDNNSNNNSNLIPGVKLAV